MLLRKLAQSLDGVSCQDFLYVIIYRVDNNEILIVAVAHLHRKPKYWMERMTRNGQALSITPQNKTIAKKIEALVDEILQRKSDPSELEREIDRTVYELYKLTPEEMGIVGKWKVLEKGLKVLQVEFCY